MDERWFVALDIAMMAASCVLVASGVDNYRVVESAETFNRSPMGINPNAIIDLNSVFMMLGAVAVGVNGLSSIEKASVGRRHSPVVTVFGGVVSVGLIVSGVFGLELRNSIETYSTIRDTSKTVPISVIATGSVVTVLFTVLTTLMYKTPIPVSTVSRVSSFSQVTPVL